QLVDVSFWRELYQRAKKHPAHPALPRIESRFLSLATEFQQLQLVLDQSGNSPPSIARKVIDLVPELKAEEFDLVKSKFVALLIELPDCDERVALAKIL